MQKCFKNLYISFKIRNLISILLLTLITNNKAEYEKLPAAEFEVKQLIRPVFSAGVGYKLPSAADDKGNFWTLGLQLTAYTPPTALNSGSLYYFNVWSASASLFVRYVF